MQAPSDEPAAATQPAHAAMGCAGSKPIDPADFIVPQDEPEEPMLVRLTSCAGSFVELVSKPRPKSEEPLKVVTWEGMVPQPLPSSAIENLDTANDTTAIVQSVDCQIYQKSPPFVISFFNANRKLVAVLSGERPPKNLGEADRMRADTAVLYVAEPPRGAAAATGHATRTTSDGSTLHAVAELRPIFSADYVARRAAKPGEQSLFNSSEAAHKEPYPWDIGLYLAGPGGTFHADPAATAPTAEGVPPFSLQPPDLRMRLAAGRSAYDYPISAIVVNARRNPVAVLQQARKRHPAWSYLPFPFLTLPCLTLPYLTLPPPLWPFSSRPTSNPSRSQGTSPHLTHSACMRPSISVPPLAPLH